MSGQADDGFIWIYTREVVWALLQSPDSRFTAYALSRAIQSRGKPQVGLFLFYHGSHFTGTYFRHHPVGLPLHEPPRVIPPKNN